MRPDQVFRNAIDSVGFRRFSPTRFRTESLEYKLIDRYKEQLHNIYKSTRSTPGQLSIDIYCKLYGEDEVNGLAFVEDGLGFVGIPVGTILVLYDTFYRMLSHPDFLPHLGDRSLEAIQGFHSDGIISNYSALLKKRLPGTSGLAAVRPKDEDRAIYAEFLASIALDFVTRHEIGHVRNGHNEYAKKYFALNLLSEVNLTGKHIGTMTRQAIETNADQYAVFYGFQNYIHSIGGEHVRARTKQEQSADTQDPPYVAMTDAETSVSDWLLAHCILTWHFGHAVNFGRLEQERYQPASTRNALSLMIADMIPKHQFPDHAKIFRNALTAASFRASTGQILISGGIEDPNTSYMDDISNVHLLSKHKLKIKEEWDRIRLDAQKHIHFDLSIVGTSP